MGQYYKPAILGKNKKTVLKWFYSHKYGEAMGGFCGLKLMEHSWLKSRFVGAVESFIKGNPQHLVWAGDYATECKGLKTNVYSRCKDETEAKPEEIPPQLVRAKYIVNHTKKQFINKTKVPVSDTYKNDKTGKVYEYRIHPLPLMTCEGNGRGGGDFRGDNELVGAWARDLISVESRVPKGFKEIIFDLVE